MRKVQLVAVFWTMLLAIPFTVLALFGLAYTTEHLTRIGAAITVFSRATSVGGRGWYLELSARWPEIAGMIVGMLVILIILVLARQDEPKER